MEVILTTNDGEVKATIQSLRAFPMLLQWSDLNTPLPPRFFVRTGGQLDNHYTESRIEPILTFGEHSG